MTAMSAAKREAARRGLYAQFMKGKVILPVAPVEQEVVASRKGKERGVLLNGTSVLPSPFLLKAC